MFIYDHRSLILAVIFAATHELALMLINELSIWNYSSVLASILLRKHLSKCSVLNVVATFTPPCLVLILKCVSFVIYHRVVFYGLELLGHILASYSVDSLTVLSAPVRLLWCDNRILCL